MGIQGLLPLLKSIMVPIHIKDLEEGSSVAIDTYSWLHKGALSCSKDLCLGRPTSKVNLLRHHGVKPILVFDGGFLPMKSDQENKRARSRKENLARAIEHESCGNSAAAYECYQKAVDISPSVAYDLIQVLKQENVGYVVAPYEADAQMTFLAISKQVDAVITEDSDLIAFGCPRIIYKMDKFGQGVEFCYSMLQQNKELNFTGFTKQMLLEMCIFSGCDYLPSLPGMGLKKAHALITKFKSYDKVIKHLKYNTITVPPLYEESFKKAMLTFQHQRVYDPIKEDIVHLSDPSENIGEDLDFLGPYPLESMPQHIAKGIASGDIDPLSKIPFQGECAKSLPALDGICQLKHLKQTVEKNRLELPAQKNLLTNYFCFATLEAKRKFRVPRTTPKHTNLKSQTPSQVEDINEEDKSCKINCSPATPAKDSVDNGVSPKAFVFSETSIHEAGPHDRDYLFDDVRERQNTLLPQSRRPIHPCIELRKGLERNSASDACEGKMRTENKKVIVRSSYFQKKENNQENKNEDSGEGKTEIENLNTTARSSFFHHKSMKENDESNNNGILLNKNADASDKYESTIFAHEDKSALDSVKRTTRTENRKAIVRSSYFQDKSSKEDDQENKNENLLVKNGAANDACEDMITMKRKFDPIDTAQTEHLNHKYMRTKGPQTIQSISNSDLDDSLMEPEAKEEKFGCNISHLGQYSEIAEKSIEKFVSVISSFRCSSGSRASGLRAPLKDVQNTCTRNRSNAVAPIILPFFGILLSPKGVLLGHVVEGHRIICTVKRI
ncbi:hypothetical protein LguiB_004793 [Lonicera macranthoides]